MSKRRRLPNIDINLLDLVILTELCLKIYETVERYEPSTPEEIQLFKRITDRVILISADIMDAEAIITISKDLQTLIITVCGTDSIEDWIDNFDTVLTRADKIKYQLLGPPEPNHNIKFHAGFLHQAMSLYKLLIPIIESFKVDGGREIIFSGHSLGGAVASIIAYYCEETGLWGSCSKIVSFGAPKFCNAAGVTWFEDKRNISSYIRVVNHMDTIPYLPPKTLKEYVHIYKSVIYFKDGKVLLDIKPNEISGCKFLTLFCTKQISPTEHNELIYIELIKKFPALYTLNI
jgi:predicted lipase